MWIAYVIIICIILLYLYYTWMVKNSLNGVWEGHENFLEDANLDKFILIIDGDSGSLMIENENGIVFNDKVELSIGFPWYGLNVFEYSISIKPLPTPDYEKDIILRYDYSKGLVTLKNDKILAEMYKNNELSDIEEK